MSRKFRSKKYWWTTSREKIFFLFFLGLFFLITPQKEGERIEAVVPEFPVVIQQPVPTPKIAAYPVNTTGVSVPAITAHAVYVVDINSAVPLYAKNEREMLPPASTTKLMTALVALDEYKLDDIVEVKPSTISGQKIDLVAGEKMTVENLLYGMLIQSGNDAAEQIALHHPQGHAEFIGKMNEKARLLNLTESFFENSVGLDEPNQRMSARDLLRLSEAAIRNPLLAKIVAIPQITISDTTHTVFHPLKSTNILLGKIPGVAGIKTGYTEEAGENLVTLVERGDRRIIIVVLRSKDRFADTTSLIQWTFANHQWIEYGI